jgi:peroxiredoxin
MDVFLITGFAVLTAIVLLNLVLTLAIIRKLQAPISGNGPGYPDPLKPGEPAPDFTAETLSGEKVTLASYSGHQTAFIFISPTCGPCRIAIPRYESLIPKARQFNTELVLVSIVDSNETKAFVEELDVSMPILVAPRTTNSFQVDYKLSSTPSYCLIDEYGKVKSSGYPSFEGAGAWKELVEPWMPGSKLADDLAITKGGAI